MFEICFLNLVFDISWEMKDLWYLVCVICRANVIIVKHHDGEHHDIHEHPDHACVADECAPACENVKIG